MNELYLWLTKRPSANQPFRMNVTAGMRSIAPWYVRYVYRGPFRRVYSRLGISRSSMYKKDWLLKLVVLQIVTNENMATVWATSIHLKRLPAWANKANIHWKKRMMRIPEMVY